MNERNDKIKRIMAEVAVTRNILDEAFDKHGFEIIEMYFKEHVPLITKDIDRNILTTPGEVGKRTSGDSIEERESICKFICDRFNIDYEALIQDGIEKDVKEKEEFFLNAKARAVFMFIKGNVFSNDKCKDYKLGYDFESFKNIGIEKIYELLCEFENMYGCTYDQWYIDERQRCENYSNILNKELHRIDSEHNELPLVYALDAFKNDDKFPKLTKELIWGKGGDEDPTDIFAYI